MKKRRKNRNKEQGNKWETVTNTTDNNPDISIITLTVNGLSIPIKRQRLPGVKIGIT